jgi:hypothetical protein
MNRRARFFRLRDAAAHRQYANSMATWKEQCADPGRFFMHTERPIVARGIFLALAHRAAVEGRGLIPVSLLCLLLAGCGPDTMIFRAQTVNPPTPAIILTTNPAVMDRNNSAEHTDQNARAGATVYGLNLKCANAILIRVDDLNALTIDDSLKITHELTHYAAQHYHGDMWALLKAMGWNQHQPGKEETE